MKKVLIFVLLVSGCSKDEEIHHGYTFNDVDRLNDTVNELREKQSKQQDVKHMLGTPTFAEIHGDQESFFYVEDIFQKGTIKKEKRDYSKVLRIDFDKKNITNAQMYKINAKFIFDDSLTTEVKANKLGILEQMQKNFISVNSIKADKN